MIGLILLGSGLLAANADVQKSVEKSLALLQASSTEFFKKSGCVGCHHQNLTAMAVAAAREKNLEVDETAAAEQLKVMKYQWAFFEEQLRQRIDPPGGADTLNYSLLSMAAAKYPADSATDAMVGTLAGEQMRDGSWHIGGIARAPIEDGDIARTALALRGMQLYAPAGRKAEFEERVERARRWLLGAKPRATEDLDMQLLGLYWAKAGPGRIAELSQALSSQQRADGGWAQNPNLESDAYATGQVLYVLHEAGLPAGDAGYQRGVAFLLKTQLADGSWHVKSRAPKFQPYFQSGFPHDHDQWISAAATAWASMALTASVAK